MNSANRRPQRLCGGSNMSKLFEGACIPFFLSLPLLCRKYCSNGVSCPSGPVVPCTSDMRCNQHAQRQQGGIVGCRYGMLLKSNSPTAGAPAQSFPHQRSRLLLALIQLRREHEGCLCGCMPLGCT